MNKNWPLLLIACFAMAVASAQTLFTYGDYSADAKDFLRAFNKNNTAIAATKSKAMRDYLDLYITSRLKIREAYDRHYDTLPQIRTDIENLRSQIIENYLNDPELSAKIAQLIQGHASETDYFIDKLAYGVGKIAAAFYPEKVIVRFSDFKSNEYFNLLGGKYFEPTEENPMIGWRGASRYYSPEYKPAFELECKAILKVRETMGLKNVVVMIPFCRTVEELQLVLATMEEFGLRRGQNGLEVYLMAELPSNIMMAEEFSAYIDGFSIGSNDLTQLTLGLDRDSSLVANLYNERNPAVQRLIAHLIKVAKQQNVKVGICGQGPSDFPDFTKFLVQLGIDSISVTPDAIIKTVMAIHEAED